MIAFDGVFYEGRSSGSIAATAKAWPELNRIDLVASEFEHKYALDSVKISARVADIPRRLTFPGGATFETPDNRSVDTLLSARGAQTIWRFSLHLLESRWRYALGALAVAALGLWAMIDYAIPALAEQGAYAIPLEMESQIGKESLQALDDMAFSPSCLPAAEQERGRRLFGDLKARLPGIAAARLEFRTMKGEIANAFALPAGIVVVTDRLMSLADKDEELLAVLAHELGHVHHRHSLRSWLQNSVTALLVASVLGDLSSISANVAVLPTLLLESKYSRVFEEQADDFAASALHGFGLSSCHFAALLNKLEAQLPKREKYVLDYLSTHPATDERIARLAGQEKASGLAFSGCVQ